MAVDISSYLFPVESLKEVLLESLFLLRLQHQSENTDHSMLHILSFFLEFPLNVSFVYQNKPIRTILILSLP